MPLSREGEAWFLRNPGGNPFGPNPYTPGGGGGDTNPQRDMLAQLIMAQQQPQAPPPAAMPMDQTGPQTQPVVQDYGGDPGGAGLGLVQQPIGGGSGMSPAQLAYLSAHGLDPNGPLPFRVLPQGPSGPMMNSQGPGLVPVNPKFYGGMKVGPFGPPVPDFGPVMGPPSTYFNPLTSGMYGGPSGPSDTLYSRRFGDGDGGGGVDSFGGGDPGGGTPGGGGQQGGSQQGGTQQGGTQQGSPFGPDPSEPFGPSDLGPPQGPANPTTGVSKGGYLEDPNSPFANPANVITDPNQAFPSAPVNPANAPFEFYGQGKDIYGMVDPYSAYAAANPQQQGNLYGDPYGPYGGPQSPLDSPFFGNDPAQPDLTGVAPYGPDLSALGDPYGAFASDPAFDGFGPSGGDAYGDASASAAADAAAADAAAADAADAAGDDDDGGDDGDDF